MHTTGGYLLQATLTTKYVFDLKDEDTYWCTADIGWVTGHSYVVYGPLANGATTVMYEGAPNHPGARPLLAHHRAAPVNIFYTAPTAIRAFVQAGASSGRDSTTSRSLRLLGTVGEPINPEAWMWYHAVIGGERCPIVDTWWQTETGAIMITPLPGATPTKPGSAHAAVLRRRRRGRGQATASRCPPARAASSSSTSPGRRCCARSTAIPSATSSSTGASIPGIYFTGDGARRDADGYFWIMGRVDDVINVAGHRLGTMEVESALVSHPEVAEAAVVGRPDELKGQAIVRLRHAGSGPQAGRRAARPSCKEHVVKEIGAFARPDDIRFTDALPKTRSGKIMRRLLRDIAAGKETVGDTTTLEDYSVLAKLREDEE